VSHGGCLIARGQCSRWSLRRVMRRDFDRSRWPMERRRQLAVTALDGDAVDAGLRQLRREQHETTLAFLGGGRFVEREFAVGANLHDEWFARDQTLNPNLCPLPAARHAEMAL